MTTLIDQIRSIADAERKRDLLKLARRIRQTDALLRSLREQFAEEISRVEPRLQQEVLSEDLLAHPPDGCGVAGELGVEIPAVHVEPAEDFQPSDDLSQESSDQAIDALVEREHAAIALHRLRINNLEDLREQRRKNALRRISPRQRAIAAQAAEYAASHARRLAQDETEPGRDYME